MILINGFRFFPYFHLQESMHKKQNTHGRLTIVKNNAEQKKWGCERGCMIANNRQKEFSKEWVHFRYSPLMCEMHFVMENLPIRSLFLQSSYYWKNTLYFWHPFVYPYIFYLCNLR